MAATRDLSGNGGRFGVGQNDPQQPNEGLEGVFTGKRADNMPMRSTYGASAFGIVPAGPCTDLFDLNNVSGSGKLVRVLSVTLSGTITTPENREIRLNRHGVNTGGTATLPARVPHDSRDPIAAAIAKAYTANPTITGTAVLLHTGRLNIAPAANGSIDRLMWQFSWINDKPLILLPGEALAVNLNNATLGAGAALDIDWLWTEESLI